MRARAAQYAAELNFRLHLIDSTIQSLSLNPVIANAPIDSEGRESYLTPFLKGFRNIDNIPIEITLTDFEGKPIIRTGKDHVFDSVRSWVRQSLEIGMDRATIVEHQGLPYLITAYMISYARTLSIEGALIAIVPLNHLRPAANAADAMPFIVSLVWPGKRKAEDRSFPSAANALASGDIYEVEHLLRVTGLLAPLGLTVRVAALETDVFARWYRLSEYFLFGGLAVSLLVALLCFWGGRRLTRPLRELEAIAQSAPHL